MDSTLQSNPTPMIQLYKVKDINQLKVKEWKLYTMQTVIL